MNALHGDARPRANPPKAKTGTVLAMSNLLLGVPVLLPRNTSRGGPRNSATRETFLCGVQKSSVATRIPIRVCQLPTHGPLVNISYDVVARAGSARGGGRRALIRAPMSRSRAKTAPVAHPFSVLIPYGSTCTILSY